MVAPRTTNPVVNPTLVDTFASLKQDIFRSMNCVKVGIIQTYDPNRHTAEVQIAFKRVLNDGTISDYPLLVDCPVFTLQGGGGSIQFPISAGDNCVVLFSDRNIDAWFQNGTPAAPFDARCHDLSDGIVLVGINSLASDLASIGSGVVGMTYEGATVALKNGLISLANDTKNFLIILNLFIDLLKTLQVQNGGGTLPLTAASITALELFKLEFAGLFTDAI